MCGCVVSCVSVCVCAYACVCVHKKLKTILLYCSLRNPVHTYRRYLALMHINLVGPYTCSLAGSPWHLVHICSILLQLFNDGGVSILNSKV